MDTAFNVTTYRYICHSYGEIPRAVTILPYPPLLNGRMLIMGMVIRIPHPFHVTLRLLRLGLFRGFSGYFSSTVQSLPVA